MKKVLTPLLLEPFVETQRLRGMCLVAFLSFLPLGNILFRDSERRMFLCLGDRDVALGHDSFL